MYAVIFRANVNELDEHYLELAARLRELAVTHYGCVELETITDGAQEITISYWRNLEQIKQWKLNSEHIGAQQLGRAKWYDSYKVQIAEIISEYKNP
jgi:heme-degrading monooxygenase HmoA